MSGDPLGLRTLLSQVPGNGGICVGFLADPGPGQTPTTAGSLMYLCGLALDVLIDKMQQGILARMPGYGTPTALPIIGQDRGIVQGFAESSAAYSLRLAAWLDSWQRAGSPRAVLQQVLGYVGVTVRARTVDDSGNWNTYAPNDNPALYGPAAISLSPLGANNWNWDNEGDPHPVGSNAWWRWWLVLYSTSTSGASWAGTEGTWGDGDVWGDATKSWGLGVPATLIGTIRSIVRQWKRAASWCRWMIVSLDDTLFDPNSEPDGVHDPNGGWGHWSVVTSGQYVPARPASARYCDGIATSGTLPFPYF